MFSKSVLLIIGVVAASLALTEASITWNGNWAFGCDFNGNDIKSENIPGEQCGGRCYNTQECTHFTWTKANGGTCWMKRGGVTKGDAVETGDNSMVCGVIREQVAAPTVQWNGNNWAFGCDFSGNDLKNEQIPGEQCGGRCYNTPGCTHFTWTVQNGGTCWMKKGSVGKEDAIATGDNSMVCGVIHENAGNAIEWNGNNWAFGCDFPGNDLRSENIPGEQCGGRCYNTQGCTHFAWTTANGGTCKMKSGSVTKSDAVASDDKSMVCGVIHEGSDGGSGGGGTDGGNGGDGGGTGGGSGGNGGGSGGGGGGSGSSVAGKTTRYWDCCKPSCSWLGKTPGNNYVNTCTKDGNNVISDPNARSGCDGGPAFSCNNHKPWVVNDQLSYGFAAATIPGLDERGRCCACYKLDFTSGPVQGKSMIVQVSNSGSDVHPNQFDLQIPGGGVGIFNGCSSQWGAPSNGWGQRYGGVSSRSECNQLPSQIRDGCYWRFDWFKGSDNPEMVYSRVRCPDAIVAVSGCRRDDDN